MRLMDSCFDLIYLRRRAARVSACTGGPLMYHLAHSILGLNTFEPGVSEDEAVASQVSDIEVLSVFGCSLFDPKLAYMVNEAIFVWCSINIPDFEQLL